MGENADGIISVGKFRPAMGQGQPQAGFAWAEYPARPDGKLVPREEFCTELPGFSRLLDFPV